MLVAVLHRAEQLLEEEPRKRLCEVPPLAKSCGHGAVRRKLVHDAEVVLREQHALESQDEGVVQLCMQGYRLLKVWRQWAAWCADLHQHLGDEVMMQRGMHRASSHCMCNSDEGQHEGLDLLKSICSTVHRANLKPQIT